MNEIDEEIKSALEDEDAKLFAELSDEAGVFELVGMSFKGKNAWVAWYMWIMGFIVFVLGVYALTLFLAENDLKTAMGWALTINACMFVIALIKIMSWQQMHKLEVMREIKRMEVRLLSQK